MILELYYYTELGAVIDRNKGTRCIAICITIQVFHIAIRFLAYCCTPTIYHLNVACKNVLLLFGTKILLYSLLQAHARSKKN